MTAISSGWNPRFAKHAKQNNAPPKCSWIGAIWPGNGEFATRRSLSGAPPSKRVKGALMANGRLSLQHQAATNCAAYGKVP